MRSSRHINLIWWISIVGVLVALFTLNAAISLPPLVGAASAAPDSQINLIGLDHVAINVKDIKRSVNWYHRIFGFNVLYRWPSGTTMVGRDNIKIGIYGRPNAKQLAQAGTPPRPDLDSELIIQHFAFMIDGDKFMQAVKTLKGTGIAYEGPEDTGIACSFFIFDPDGHKIELTTYHPSTASCTKMAF